MLLPKATFAYYVPDPAATARWYRDKLGFEILRDNSEVEGFRWVTAAPRGATWMFIFGDVRVHGEGELADRFRAELGFAPHYMLSVPELAPAIEELRRRGVEVADPEDLGGVPMAHLKDLHGNVVTLVSESDWEGLRR